MTKKIYLDQKDYIRIAKGLIGDKQYLNDVKVYDLLKSLVKSNKVKLFYSSAHIEEATNYSKEESDELDKYIEAIQSLTKGNCLIPNTEKTFREIDINLSEKYIYNSKYSKEFYAFGFSSESVIAEINQKIINKYFGITNRTQRLQLNSKLKKLSSNKLNDMFPASEIMSKPEFIKMATGSGESTRIDSFRDYLNELYGIKNYLKKYRGQVPGLIQNLSKYSTSQIGNLNYIIEDNREFVKNKNQQREYENFLLSKFVQLYLDERDVSDFISKLAVENDFDISDAVQFFKDTNMNRILSINSFNKLLIEYIKRMRGRREKARKFQKNDYLDIDHAKNLPYVDYFVCDRFFVEVTKNIASKFNTKVFKNLKELSTTLTK